MRIAYISVSNSMYIFGGEVTATMAWINTCDKEAWVFDLYMDSSCKHRERYMDSTFIPRLSRSEGAFYLDVRSISMGRIPNEDTVKIFRSCYNFLRSFETKIPDVIIYSNPYLALLAHPYGIHHYIPSYVVSHLTELLYDVPSVIPQETLDTYKMLCQISGVGIVTQCKANTPILHKQFPAKPIVTIPVFQAHEVLSSSEREGILYLGGGDNVKNPQLAAKVLSLFNAAHPEVPIIVISARRGGTVEKLFGGFAKVLVKQNRSQVGEIIGKTKLGIHTAHGESFGLAVAEQLVQYPVILYDKPYKVVFPVCPVFTSAEEGQKQLERLYYDEHLYAITRDKGHQYISSTYSQEAIREGFKETIAGYTPNHHIRDTTKVQIEQVLTREATVMPIRDLYKVLGWNSYILGMRTLLAHPNIELVHTQMQTCARLVNSDATVETSGGLF